MLQRTTTMVRADTKKHLHVSSLRHLHHHTTPCAAAEVTISLCPLLLPAPGCIKFSSISCDSCDGCNPTRNHTFSCNAGILLPAVMAALNDFQQLLQATKG